MNRVSVGVAALALLGLGACASTRPPLEELVQAEASVRAAEAAESLQGSEGAIPEAAYYLRLAENQLSLAQRLVARREYADAGPIIARSRADADVARALARWAAARAKAKAEAHEIDRLRARLR